MDLYIFGLLFLSPCLGNDFYGLSACGLYKEDYLQLFKCVSFELHSFCG